MYCWRDWTTFREMAISEHQLLSVAEQAAVRVQAPRLVSSFNEWHDYQSLGEGADERSREAGPCAGLVLLVRRCGWFWRECFDVGTPRTFPKYA